MAIALLIIAEYHIGRFTVASDHAVQYTAAKQLIAGNGLNRPVYNPADLSQPDFIRHTEFPPGMAIVLSPLFLFFKDIHTADNVFSFISLFIFLVLGYALINKLIG